MSIDPVFKEPSQQSSGDDNTPHKPKRERREGIEPRQFVRKAFYVTGIQVTESNMAEAAMWCGGEIRTNGEGRRFIKVHTTKAIYDRQTRALPGDWILKAGRNYKVYTNKAFTEVFEEAEVDGDPTVTLPPEAKAALLVIAEQLKDAAS